MNQIFCLEAFLRKFAYHKNNNLISSNTNLMANIFYDWAKGFKTFFGGGGIFWRIRSYFVGQEGAIWIDTTMPWKIYHENSQVRTIYDRYANMFSNMEIYKEKISTGERVEDPDLEKLLANPNPMQVQNELLKQYILQLNVYGNQMMYKNHPTGLTKYPSTLSLISPLYMRPFVSGKLYDQTKIEDIILYYEYQDTKTGYKRYETKDILYTKLPSLDDPIIGCSKLSGYKFPISNTEAAYKYLNIISTKKGAIGILTNESQDSSGGGVPLTPKESEELESAYTNKYGIDEHQSHVKVSNAKLKWQPFSYPTRDLLLLEQIDANGLVIIDSLGLNANIFSNKNSTYENVKNGIILSYQDAIQPAADLFMQALGSFIGIDKQYRLCASYEHLSILAGDEKEKADTLKVQFEAVVQLATKGIIDNEQACAMILDLTGIPIKSNGKDIVATLNRMSPLVSNNVIQQLTINQVLSLVGQPPVPNGDMMASELRAEQQAQVQLAAAATQE